MLTLCTAYLLTIAGGPSGVARMRIPLMPLVCLLAGIGISNLWRWWSGDRSDGETLFTALVPAPPATRRRTAPVEPQPDRIPVGSSLEQLPIESSSLSKQCTKITHDFDDPAGRPPPRLPLSRNRGFAEVKPPHWRLFAIFPFRPRNPHLSTVDLRRPSLVRAAGPTTADLPLAVQMLRYLVVGGVAFVADFGMLVLLTSGLRLALSAIGRDRLRDRHGRQLCAERGLGLQGSGGQEARTSSSCCSP